MSKKRAALKYGAAGAVTALYTTAAIRKWMGLKDDQQPISKERFAVTVAVIGALTWVAALA